MRPARPLSGLAILILGLSFALAACDEDNAWSSSAQGGDGGRVDRVRAETRTVSDRQFERRRARRDRTSRRLGRGGGELLPHHGDYAIHESGFSTPRFKSAHGTLTVSLIDDCDDWTLQEKWDLDLRDQTDEHHRSSVLYRASEMRSTDQFVFAYSREHLGARTDFIGNVRRIDDGFLVRFRAPEMPDLFLSPDVLFPVTHRRQVLAAARRQLDEFEATVFDGGNSFPYRALTRIGLPLRRDERNPLVAAARSELDLKTSDQLPDGRHWPVRIDYFPLDDAFAPPVFTREFLLHESGIVLSFYFDYGDIRVDARLKNLDIREASDCPS